MTTTTLSESRATTLPKDRTLVSPKDRALVSPKDRALVSPKDRALVGALALFLGLGFIFLVGFAPVSAVHNAAHDTRHSAAFPCH
jgi:cobalt transporter subunit CbtB